MTDHRFNQALNIALMLDQNDCLKQDAGFNAPKGQKPIKPCNKQIKAIIIIHEFLLGLQQHNGHCPFCGNTEQNQRTP
jgi:hypothetical protein